MALFEFKLKDIKEIQPWGEASDLSLNWFGLTDSYYYLNVQENKLFTYSKEILNYWREEHPSEYIDYQVVRLYEDLLEILPDILQSIPQDIYEYINSYEAQQLFEKQINEVLEQNLDDEIIDLHYEASYWLSLRFINSAYLVEGPRICFLNYKEEIIVRWYNENKNIDGIQPWLEIKGEKKYSRQEFINEIKLFHDRLMNEMQIRVDAIIQENPIPNINIDKDYLINENIQRKKSLENALNMQPSITDWNSVIYAIKKIKT